jgi:endonuclease IV
MVLSQTQLDEIPMIKDTYKAGPFLEMDHREIQILEEKEASKGGN